MRNHSSRQGKAQRMTRLFFPFDAFPSCVISEPPHPHPFHSLLIYCGSGTDHVSLNCKWYLAHSHCSCNETFLSPLCLTKQWRNPPIRTTVVSKWGYCPNTGLLPFTHRCVKSLYFHWLRRRKLPLNPAKEALWLMTQQEVALTQTSCLRAEEDAGYTLLMCPICWTVTEC